MKDVYKTRISIVWQFLTLIEEVTVLVLLRTENICQE